jgi:phosphoribosylformylglycinamidine synthase
MVGLIAEEQYITRQFFQDAGDVVFLVGPVGIELGGSHYLKVVHGRKEGRPPRLDYERELAVHSAALALIRNGMAKSAHDCSEGGLAVALAECCISGEKRIGAEIRLSGRNLRGDQVLFNEDQSRVIVSVSSNDAIAAEAICRQRGVPVVRLGQVGGAALVLTTGESTVRWSLDQLFNSWYTAIARIMARPNP